MKSDVFNTRYQVLFCFVFIFLLLSFVVRTILGILCAPDTQLNLSSLLRIYVQGFAFDLGVALLISALYSIYLMVLPQKWNNSKFNRIFTYVGFFLLMVTVMLSFFAEIVFWQEFESRFNFIAVDYLIYTYEVINNINQSYPLPLLIGGMLCTVGCILWLVIRRDVFKTSFNSNTSPLARAGITLSILAVSSIYVLFIKDDWAEQSRNRYENELAKAGIYSFFGAYNNNEINYHHFYKLIDKTKAFDIVRKELSGKEVKFFASSASIRRLIDADSLITKPNVIMITLESFSADFMKAFGNKENLTPFLDSLADNSLSFTSMFATGTRTIRGMEALSLSIPPTPGSSIVRRRDNGNLFTVGTIFKKAGYDRTFVYGGDGYFDNMNQYFGSNGFDIIDRGRRLIATDHFKTRRTRIADSAVHFENAWGISDEDLYDAVISDADKKYKAGKLFYDFVMTTSNHRPYTYPAGKIDIRSGSGRQGAVKYTDFAIRQFFNKIKNKPWFKNTIVILIADHCASSAGRNEINISKYHIPCLVVNLQGAPPQKIDAMCSQIDLYPTLFALMGWKYESNMFGKNVFDSSFVPRIVLGTYQKLGFLKNDSLVILGPQRAVETFIYNKLTTTQTPARFPEEFINQAVAPYQTAYTLYKHGGLKE